MIKLNHLMEAGNDKPQNDKNYEKSYYVDLHVGMLSNAICR